MNPQIRSRTRIAILGLTVLGTIVFFAGYLNRTKQTAKTNETEARATPITLTAQPALQEEPHTTPTPRQSSPLVEKLLTTEAGFVNRVLAMEWVASLISDAAACEAAISQLVKSESEAERILGHYLNYEKNGFSKRLADEIRDEPSFYVKAEIAQWLYVDRQFDEREKFTSAVTSALGEAEMTEMLSKLNEFDGMLLLPPAMRSLGLGEGMPEFITKALRDDSRFVDAGVRLLEESGMGEQGEIALLKVLERANPEGYADVLVALISRENENSHVRWKAIQDLAHMEDNRAGTQFLLEFSRTTDDVETIRHIENMVNGARDHGFPNLGELEELIEEELVDATAKSTLPKHLTEFVRGSLESNRFKPDRDLLVRAQAAFPRTSRSEPAIEKLKADIEFLTWRTSQER